MRLLQSEVQVSPFESTRDEYYVQSAPEAEIAKLLDSQLELSNDPEACYVTVDEPPQVVPGTTDGSNIFAEESGNEDNTVNPPCGVLGHQKTALTRESQATDEHLSDPSCPWTFKGRCTMVARTGGSN